MRWLIIAFLVSLGVLLLAVAGVARHVRRHRTLLKQEGAAPELTEEIETDH
jgi:hypothetical protein